MKQLSKPGQPVPERGRPQTGRVLRIARGQGQGYIRVTGDGPNVFFDRRNLIDVGFNDLEVGDSVAFELIDDRFSGPRAVLVRKVDGNKTEHGMTGTISRLLLEKGFSFIAAEDGQEYFMHRTALKDESVFEQIREGQAVTFDGDKGEKRLRAENVRLAD